MVIDGMHFMVRYLLFVPYYLSRTISIAIARDLANRESAVRNRLVFFVSQGRAVPCRAVSRSHEKSTSIKFVRQKFRGLRTAGERYTN